jgi:long-subunit fatty acid transport protein
LGGGFDFILDNYNKVTLTTEFNKLLVPTPSISTNENGGYPYVQADKGFFEGMIASFSDAPGGGKEEMQEVTWALGAEYMYNDAFSLRAGYFHESKYKGARQFMTLGAGFKFKSARLDLSYLFNTADINNPLENTLRFSLSFDFGELYEIY